LLPLIKERKEKKKKTLNSNEEIKSMFRSVILKNIILKYQILNVQFEDWFLKIQLSVWQNCSLAFKFYVFKKAHIYMGFENAVFYF
jgi:hypothetical protein